jgi:transcription elongation GreA/GreB family factor
MVKSMFDINALELKKILMGSILEDLNANLVTLISTAQEAKSAATNSESKPENKYDTRGLEASYLAGAQAKRSHELEKVIFNLRSLMLREFSKNAVIDLTAIVQLQSNGEAMKWFFILPSAGGLKVSWDSIDFQVLTPESPLGSKLKGKKVGDEFSFRVKNQDMDYEILALI